MLSHPSALLLDFGGVIADAPPQSPAPAELVDRLHTLIDGAVPTGQIATSLVDGERAYAAWRDSVGAQERPTELRHVQVWEDFVTCRWPAPAREAVRRAATSLSYAWTWRPKWALRPGITEVLHAAAVDHLPIAIVSNTLCGAAHRDFLTQTGVTDLFAAQLYSDETGVRKPNPELAWRAAHALDVPIAECWFVGDSHTRDIACARRAGAGAAILMRSPRTARDKPAPGGVPDATIDDGHGLIALLDAFRSR